MKTFFIYNREVKSKNGGIHVIDTQSHEIIKSNLKDFITAVNAAEPGQTILFGQGIHEIDKECRSLYLSSVESEFDRFHNPLFGFNKNKYFRSSWKDYTKN